jgi:hypothetical protein
MNHAPEWVRARVLAIYLFVFQGSVALGSTLWGVAAEHTSANKALLFSGIGIAACLALPVVARFPAARGSLEAWNHWGKLPMVTEPEPDEGPVLGAIEYKVDPEKVPEFLDALHDYQRIRRRDGAMRGQEVRRACAQSCSRITEDTAFSLCEPRGTSVDGPGN